MWAGAQEGRAGNPNFNAMKGPSSKPSAAGRRPPEPLRPLPARRAGVGLLAAQARRRRYRRSDLR